MNVDEVQIPGEGHIVDEDFHGEFDKTYFLN